MHKFKYRHIFINLIPFWIFLSIFLFVSPVMAQPLVPCGNPGQQACGFFDLIRLVQNITNFLLIVAAPVAALLFAYAGFKYVFAAGKEGDITQAHKIFWTALWGLVFMASAWLVVKIIVTTLGSAAGRQFLP